jgi:hypothetical protein
LGRAAMIPTHRSVASHLMMASPPLGIPSVAAGPLLFASDIRPPVHLRATDSRQVKFAWFVH